MNPIHSADLLVGPTPRYYANRHTHRDRPAVVMGERRVTWQELDDRVDRVAAGFMRLGVKRGQRVGLLLRNGPEYVELLFGLARAGITSASLWATVPHYVGQTPSPKAALALVERAADLLDSRVATTDLDIAAAAYERQVSEAVDADEDASAYVRSLEVTDDDADDADLDDLDEGRLEGVGGDALAAEVERFLREHGQA